MNIPKECCPRCFCAHNHLWDTAESAWLTILSFSVNVLFINKLLGVQFTKIRQPLCDNSRHSPMAETEL